MEQNKEVNQGQNNIPDNPYTESYLKYIAKPVTAETKASGAAAKALSPKQIISMILCGVSTAWIVIFVALLALIILSGNGGRTEDVRFTIYFLSIISLGPAIVAKVLNRKSIWALVNIICLGILFVALIVAISI